ncbi:MAG: ABC transporter ATP-binding protein [Clostridium argentinense]|uniref:ABC transporter ATP-binding protein n=1 Tax=Clostridium faecium TaxID=2762223 RepID=A0ABR8YUC0_9CLOT|nr:MULTISPECIES: ABC transporter ATP-binding protein [Clostridium]MBD8047588.1 ABC transporter ATP-binding protein [Clostridium faecium]MBS5822983.1 ABC transporter ATP-binding protein [Clostridium argentinense]MDU1349773.1 ABC transporter ATP-binding protein [Clostridium argentinense]
MKKQLEVKNLRVSYHTYAGEVQSVRGMSFDVDKGESVAIVGESGCGKTVTAKSIMGLIQSPPGEIKEGSEILYKGENILKFSKKQWQDFRGEECSMIFQDALTALNPTMKVGKQIAENLMIHRKLSKAEALNEAKKMLELVGIPNADRRINQYPHEFSGGMRQRAMIAMALACSPNILIADEPTTALDVTIQAQIIDILKSLQQKLGMSIILITHDLGVVANLVDRIFVMYAGKIVERGSYKEIFYNPKHPYTWALLKAVPRLDSENDEELVSIQGTPPDLIKPPKGCGFASRCKYCMNICLREEPPLTEFEKEHTASCWIYHPMAPKVENGFKAEVSISGSKK